MLIDEYKDYLQHNSTLSPTTIAAYASKLGGFLKQNYSEADLIGAVDQLMVKHGPGTPTYAADHGRTYHALKWLNEYIIRDYAHELYVKYTLTPQVAWRRMDKHLCGYELRDRQITLTYNDGAQVTKALPDTVFYVLVKFIKKHKRSLSCIGHTALQSAPALWDYNANNHRYDYTFEDKACTDCATLFEDEDDKRKEWLNTQYDAILSPVWA